MKKTPPDSPNTNRDSADSKPSTERSERTRKSRRKLIQLLATGGVITSAKVIPTDWAKPVVETVTLPAHAQTTEPDDDKRPRTCRLGVNINDLGRDETSTVSDKGFNGFADLSTDIVKGLKNLGEEVLDEFIGEAWADTRPEICDHFTGCFWVEFECKSLRPKQLCFIVLEEVSTGDDRAEYEPREYCTPLDADGAGGHAGVSFQVDIRSRDEAWLTISGCCDGSGDITARLGSDYNCDDASDSVSGIFCDS